MSTGPHGLSRLGLSLLLRETPADSLGCRDGIQRALQAHRRPLPRFDAVEALERSRPPQEPWRVGGTDSSDGLAAAVALLARGSGCTALLERANLPIDPVLAPLEQAEAWCLGGGEDFELVLALPPAWCAAFLDALPGSRALGRLSAGPVGVYWSDTGQALDASLGYSHFGNA